MKKTIINSLLSLSLIFAISSFTIQKKEEVKMNREEYSVAKEEVFEYDPYKQWEGDSLSPRYEYTYPQVFLTTLMAYEEVDAKWANNRIPLYFNDDFTLNEELTINQFHKLNIIENNLREQGVTNLYFNYYKTNDTETDTYKTYAMSDNLEWEHHEDWEWDSVWYSESYTPKSGDVVPWEEEVNTFLSEPYAYNNSNYYNGEGNGDYNKNWLVMSTTEDPLDGYWVANRLRFYIWLPVKKFAYLKIENPLDSMTDYNYVESIQWYKQWDAMTILDVCSMTAESNERFNYGYTSKQNNYLDKIFLPSSYSGGEYGSMMSPAFLYNEKQESGNLYDTYKLIFEDWTAMAPNPDEDYYIYKRYHDENWNNNMFIENTVNTVGVDPIDPLDPTTPTDSEDSSQIFKWIIVTVVILSIITAISLVIWILVKKNLDKN